MDEKKKTVLKIDKDFRCLIRPLHRSEYLQLEANLLSDGCRDPITVWNGYIVDGHNRYEICMRHNIPFAVHEMRFECREEAIAWICANQLGRRNITEETRKFLIGMQYESEKIVNQRKNSRGKNQYSDEAEDIYPQAAEKTRAHATAARLAEENHVSAATVQKYAEYTRALKEIGRKMPSMVPKILAGRYKISHKNLVSLAKLDEEQLKKTARRIEQTQLPFIQYSQTRREIQHSKGASGAAPSIPSVKDMPEYDPDAEITGLTLTIPSWSSSIMRIRTKSDLTTVSDTAKEKLTSALSDLQTIIYEMLSAIKEE